MGPERFGLNPGASERGEGPPDIQSEQSGAAEPERRENPIGPLVDVGDVPLVIAAQERLAHSIENLGCMTLKRALAKQHGEPIVGRVGANLDRSPVAAVEHLMHHRDLLGMGPVEGASQRGVGQRGAVPDNGAEQIGGRSAG